MTKMSSQRKEKKNPIMVEQVLCLVLDQDNTFYDLGNRTLSPGYFQK